MTEKGYEKKDEDEKRMISMSIGSIQATKQHYHSINNSSSSSGGGISSNSNNRTSDIYFETYSPLPLSAKKEDDPESMFSPSRPTRYTLPWPFNTYRRKPFPKRRRLIDRDGLFQQSLGKLSVRKKIKIKEWRSMYGTDWFHSLVDSPTWRTILILLSIYVLMVVLFAIPYYYIGRWKNDVCQMGLKNYHEAFNFSLETMATIGFGTKDIFFGDCISVSIVLTLQICFRIVSDALTIGIIYSRLARPTTRASTIIISANAVIRRIRGKLYFMIQTCELRKHQLVEAHVRMYVLKTETDIDHGRLNEPVNINLRHYSREDQDREQEETLQNYVEGSKYFQTCPLRITQPNDERGAMLLLCLPQIIVHEINESSPLRPPNQWRSNVTGQIFQKEELLSYLKSRPSMIPPTNSNSSNINSMPTSRTSYLPKSSFTTPTKTSPHYSIDDYHSHHESDSLVDKKDDKNKDDSNNNNSSNTNQDYESRYQTYDEDRIPGETAEQRLERYMIQTYMADRKMEIITIIEGSDQSTGGVVQARHSFVSNEIKWYHTFAPCLFEDSLDGSAVIDFNLFHKTRPVQADANSPGAVASFVC